MSTYFPKGQDKLDRKWFVVDATGLPVGRLSTVVADVLSGKNKPTWTPFLDMGDHVVVINAEKVRLTGKKLDLKLDFRHSGWPGGDRHTPYRTMLEQHPERVFELAVKGMLPKSSLGRQMIKKMIVYKGPDHKQQAQQPEPLEI